MLEVQLGLYPYVSTIYEEVIGKSESGESRSQLSSDLRQTPPNSVLCVSAPALLLAVHANWTALLVPIRDRIIRGYYHPHWRVKM